jgi:hypothetical protein
MRIEKEVVEEAIDTEEDLVIAVDTVVFKKSVKCRNIVSKGYRRNINAGDINAGDINAWVINAWDINAGDINAGDINAWVINARDINAGFIVCEKRKKKIATAKTVCKNIIEKRSSYKKEEKQESEK